MISIKAKIDIGGDGAFSASSSSATPLDKISNASSELGNILGNKKAKNLVNGFKLGKSILGKGGVYVKKLPYFVGNQLSDSNGNFSTTYTIHLEAGKGGSRDWNVITVLFDEKNGNHPNSIRYKYATTLGGEWVEEKFTYDNDARFELSFEVPASKVEIYIDNWNKPNSPLIIMGIYAISDYVIDNKNLVSFNSDILDRSNTQEPNYGLISNSASLSFIDFNGEIFELISKKAFRSGLKVDVYLDNPLTVDEQICSMQIQQLDYDNNNQRVDVQLKDNLENLQETNMEAIPYTPTVSTEQKAYWLYKELEDKTLPLGYTIAPLDSKVSEVLNNTIIQYPLLESDNIWNEWTKLCELCLLNMYIDNNGKIVLK